VEVDKIRYFNEMPWCLLHRLLLPKTLAAVMDVAEGLALVQ